MNIPRSIRQRESRARRKRRTVQGLKWEMRSSGKAPSTSGPVRGEEGHAHSLLITKRWDKQDRVNTDSEQPQEEERRVQKGPFASTSRIHIVGII